MKIRMLTYMIVLTGYYFMTICACAGEMERHELKPLAPDEIENDEEKLKKQAELSKPTWIDDGAILQYDLVAARVATHKGQRDLMVRFRIPVG